MKVIVEFSVAAKAVMHLTYFELFAEELTTAAAAVTPFIPSRMSLRRQSILSAEAATMPSDAWQDAVVLVRRQRNRRQDADDRNHDHQLDQGETLLDGTLHGSAA
jgi:hypothetical protein